MSTTAVIGLKEGNNYSFIRLIYDGDKAGKLLKGKYTSIKKIKELMKLGDLYHIRENTFLPEGMNIKVYMDKKPYSEELKKALRYGDSKNKKADIIRTMYEEFHTCQPISNEEIHKPCISFKAANTKEALDKFGYKEYIYLYDTCTKQWLQYKCDYTKDMLKVPNSSERLLKQAGDYLIKKYNIERSLKSVKAWRPSADIITERRVTLIDDRDNVATMLSIIKNTLNKMENQTGGKLALFERNGNVFIGKCIAINKHRYYNIRIIVGESIKIEYYFGSIPTISPK